MKLAALTFDDGPDSTTPALLSILDEYNVKADFFLTGDHIRSYPAMAEQIYRRGHELANHSLSHTKLGAEGGASKEEVQESLEQTSALIKNITGKCPPYMRAPYLDYSPLLLQTAAELYLPLIDISVNSFDYTGIGADEIINNVVPQVTDGSIILLHEPYQSTRSALPEILRSLKTDGFEFLPIRQLAARKNKKLNVGTIYSRL